MKRVLAVLVLVGFLIYTGIYVFVYLFRAFRLAEPDEALVVYVWHGDPMTRAVLVSVLFAIGLLLLLFVVTLRPKASQRGAVHLRSDLWSWLSERAANTSETPDAVAERAVAAYRAAVEEGRPIHTA